MCDIKVSVIVPVFNAELYLRRCLDSLVGQSLREVEIICVDDASTDNSYMIINQYAECDKRIKVLHSCEGNSYKINKGQSVARNVGLKAASGEYILMVDADDWLELNAAEKLYNQAKKNNLDVLYFSFFSEFEDDDLKEEYNGKLNCNRDGACLEEVISGQAMLILQMDNRTLIGTVWSAIFKRSFLQENNIYFDENIRMEDSLFSIQAILYAQRTQCSKEKLYHYYRRQNSVTTSSFREQQLMDLFMMAVGEMKVALSCRTLLPKVPKYIARWVGNDFSFVLKMWSDNFKYIDENNLHFAESWKSVAFNVFRFLVNPEPALHRFTYHENDRLKKTNCVIVYGAGHVAERTLAYLHQLGFDKIKISVSNISNNYFMGNKVYQIQEICQNYPQGVVLLAVMPDKQPEMIEVLESMGISDYIIMI